LPPRLKDGGHRWERGANAYMYFVHNRTELKDRIKFRLSLYQRDIYGFIKECPNFKS